MPIFRNAVQLYGKWTCLYMLFDHLERVLNEVGNETSWIRNDTLQYTVRGISDLMGSLELYTYAQN